MKNITNCVLLLVFALTSNISHAQISFGNIDEGGAVSFVSKPREISTSNVAGSPYLNDEFQFGKVLIREESKLEGKLRYNAFNSEIELQKNDYEFSAILKRTYISAEIGDEFYKIYAYLDANSNQRTAYFINKNEGKIKLLFKPEVKLKSARPASTNYDRDVPPTFIDISSYYIVIGDKPAKKIRLKKRDVLEVLDEIPGVKEFIQKEQLKLNKEKDVISLFEYLNRQ